MPRTPTVELFGYWDVFNECLHKDKAVADKCAEGGNTIIPLYREVPVPSTTKVTNCWHCGQEWKQPDYVPLFPDADG